MTPERFVFDASPLISLDRIGRLDILTKLLDKIVVPPAVAREIGPDICQLAKISEHGLRHPLDSRIARADLGAGESEAISLALETGATRVVLDDGPARRVAVALGVPVIGTAGLLLTAKDRRVIPEVGPVIFALLASGFHLDHNVVEDILVLADEM